MSTMQSEVYDALIDAGASEPKARAAAEVIAITPKADEVASKRDIDTIDHKIETLRTETTSAIETLRTETKAEIAALENRLIKWAIGTATIVIAILSIQIQLS